MIETSGQADPLVIRCTGRPVDDELRATGEACGRVLARRWRRWTDAEYLTYARAAGWAVGPDGVACPKCRRPASLRGLAVPLFDG